MVEFKNKLGIYMVLSSIFVAWGAYLLRKNSLVPLELTLATSLAVFIVLLTAFFVFSGSRLAINLGIVLSVAAIASSLSSPAHLHAMSQIFNGGIISLLDVLEILGFYLFPILYIYTRITGGGIGISLKTE